MKNLSIRIKLIIIFILIKIIPLILITYIGIEGILSLNKYFVENTEQVYKKNSQLIQSTAHLSIHDSITALDEKSQKSIEKYTVQIAQEVASFLYERDKDLLFLSKLEISQELLQKFYNSKTKDINVAPKYEYNEDKAIWENSQNNKTTQLNRKSQLKDNEKNFRFINPNKKLTKNIPIYKEVVYFDLNGLELYKVSAINSNKKDISKKENTYIKAENYFEKIKSLKKEEIYVSDVIGSYVGSKIIGTFSKQRAKKANIEFEPKEHAYAGVENPEGKKFDGIVRFITPVFKSGVKIGYISLALDHRHIMEYTDTFNPLDNFDQLNISDGSIGNYAFMWDYEARNISHPRDYFIVGFDPDTGDRVPGWLSKKVYDDFKQSEYKDLNKFLENYPKFDNQSLQNKPNLEQLKKGEVGLDCRYLNFAPQCKGWMELTQNGGYGSFIIYWSKVWKLTTAATIPYYTGEYKNSKRGFGFVTVGANVDEFHSAANKTKERIEGIIQEQTDEMNRILKEDEKNIKEYIMSLVKELSISTLIMCIIVIYIALWMSNYISKKIAKLIDGTKEFSLNNLDYRIKISSSDEIGKLEKSFNNMAQKLKEDSIKIEEQNHIMTQQTKMAAMGEMIANIAHQWRQPLTVLSTAAGFVKLNNEIGTLDKKTVDDNMDKIVETTIHLSNTIDDFKDFFKPSKEKTYIRIEKTIDKVLNIISSKFRNKNISLIKELQSVEIKTLENELIHVILNILNNAGDALENKKESEKYIFIKTYEEKNCLIIEVLDNAGGIPNDILNKIFEPYFTTKHKSQGTGIGLYMSEEMVSKHMKGSIKVCNKEYTYENKNYKGANFTISIPLS